MISRKHKALFVHVPKCAGQSIEHLFLRELGLGWEERRALAMGRNKDRRRGPPRLAHMTLSEYLSLGYLTESEFGEYFKFAFVRNPWSRLVSEYKYRHYHYLYDFKTFVLKKFPRRGWSDEYRHVMPQWDYLVGADGAVGVDFIGRFEDMQRDFSEVASRLSLSVSSLPRVNAAGHKKRSLISRSSMYRLLGYCAGRREGVMAADYREYFDSETDGFVREFYKKDIALLGYEF